MRIYHYLLPAVILAGCAELSLFPGPDRSTEKLTDRQNALYQLKGWALKGRIAIQTDNDGVTATLHWAQIDNRYQMRFIAPLGQGTYQLRGQPGKVSLQTANNEFYEAEDPERLLQDNLGWNVPMNGLQYWIRGLPEPGADLVNLVRDTAGRITDMQQSGWRISILRYTEVKDFVLPGKLFLQNDRFKLRLVIHGWQTLS